MSDKKRKKPLTMAQLRREAQSASFEKPVRSSRNVLDSIPRIRHWLDALEGAEKRPTLFSRNQVVQDLLGMAHYVAIDEGADYERGRYAREVVDLLKLERRRRRVCPHGVSPTVRCLRGCDGKR